MKLVLRLFSIASCWRLLGVCILMLLTRHTTFGQTASSPAETYRALKTFTLSSQVIQANNVSLQRDRVTMTFTGTFYLEEAVAGTPRSAVFVGKGNFRAEPPNIEFERSNLKRLLKADVAESDFQTAVLRFTDDSLSKLGSMTDAAGAPPKHAAELAAKFGDRMLRETGANIASRLAVSIMNNEQPGFFIAQFDGGKRNRFTFLFDPQCRVPVNSFEINAGEKGLVLAHRDGPDYNDVWMAFHGSESYQNGRAEYADSYALVSIPQYTVKADVRDPKKMLKYSLRMDLISLVDGMRAIPFVLSESLPESNSMRQKRALHVRSLKWSGDESADLVQEEWEGGFTAFLPRALKRGEAFSLQLEVDGDFMYDSGTISDVFYPLNASDWLPRHMFFNRAKYDLEFRHRKPLLVAASGIRVSEGPAPDNKDEMITRWKVDSPVDLVTFGVGRFERHTELKEMKKDDVPLEFYSMPGNVMPIKEDFMLAELLNSVRYFSELYGAYPYAKLGAVFHPRGFGQGFATMLLLPDSDRASKYTYAFISHEVSHQWWGNIVAWRSYRDQWLSEGFAEYSGVWYTLFRDKRNSAVDLVREMRRILLEPPETETGLGSGRLNDIGPLIAGHRLESSKSGGAYFALTYNKGGLVLRMLHFLFTNPSNGNGDLFFDMMREFVKRHHDEPASTESLMAVANEFFPKAPIAQKYGLKNLNWFFGQWVYDIALPSYRLEYQIDNAPGGGVVVRGNVFQDNAPQGWFMPLPLVFGFGGNQFARGTVHAYGPKTPFEVPLPNRPSSVEMDPDNWVLSEKTSTKSVK